MSAQSIVIILLCAGAFAAGWLLTKRSRWSPTLRDLYGFWGIQVVVLFAALGCHVGAFGYGSAAPKYFLPVGQPVGAFFAAILFAEIKSAWRWLAIAFPILTAVARNW